MADELVFYTNPMSRGRIVRWMLEEVGQPYRTEILDYATTLKGPAYLAINPMGKIPALTHGGRSSPSAPRSARIWPTRFRRPAWLRRRAIPNVRPTIGGCSSPPGRSRRRPPTRPQDSRPRRSGPG